MNTYENFYIIEKENKYSIWSVECIEEKEEFEKYMKDFKEILDSWYTIEYSEYFWVWEFYRKWDKYVLSSWIHWNNQIYDTTINSIWENLRNRFDLWIEYVKKDLRYPKPIQ